MGIHQATMGRDVIDALEQIGGVLGYHSRREWPIPGTGDRPQAIDLCWFFDKVETSPLFAFEVESKDIAAAQGNANKLFAKSVAQLQKPLFFFHLFLDSPQDSVRKEDLLALYGRYNYGVYALNGGCLEPLLIDILGQHRRLSDRLPLSPLGQHVMSHPGWRIDLWHLCQTVFDLGFERGRGTLLGELGDLMMRGIDTRRAVHQELAYRLLGDMAFEYESYETWLGSHLQEALHWAMLASLDPAKRAVCIRAIMDWQHGDGTRPLMIGPAFGRSQDYDNFVVCWSPPIWALLVALVGDSTEFRRFVCDQIDRVVKEAENTDFAVYLPFSGLWMLMISIWDPALKDVSSRARRIIRANGGLPTSAWTDPPSILPLEEGSLFPAPVHESLSEGPRLDANQSDGILRAAVPSAGTEHQMAALTCAFELLIDDEGLFEKGQLIASLLASVQRGGQ